MNILIFQRFGIGDCIFSMQLARMWMLQGHKITWPVFPQFVSQLQRAYPFITWMDCNTIHPDWNRREEHDWNGYRCMPLAWACDMMGRPYNDCMRSKYELLGLDFSDWRKGAMWERDKVQEAVCYVYSQAQVQASIDFFGGLMPSTRDYMFVNETYGSDSKLKVKIESKGVKLHRVELMNMQGFSLFDWAAVLENATEIHTVSTSIIYLLEMLDIPGEKVWLYPRPTDPKFRQVDYLFTKNYNLVV